MMGMALGSWLALRRLPTEGNTTISGTYLAGIQVIAAASPVVLCGILQLSSRIAGQAGLLLVSYAVLPIVAVLCGALGGYQFPLASQVYFGEDKTARQNAGAVYAIDLAGACIGAVLISAYLLPVFGFLRTSALIAVLNIGAAALVLMAASRAKMHPACHSRAASH